MCTSTKQADRGGLVVGMRLYFKHEVTDWR